MLYFSERALNEIDDASFTESCSRAAGLNRWGTLSRARSTNIAPGATERVDFALKRSRRRRRRRAAKNLTRPLAPGALIDVTVRQLRVGVMPFLRLGNRGEHTYEGNVRTFWAHARMTHRRLIGQWACCDVVLLGSLDNVVNGAWNLDSEDSVKIGHDYPSDPSAIARLVQMTLGLDSREVNEHVREIEDWVEIDPGDGARFAYWATKRASDHSYIEPGHIGTWERRRPLASARIVAIVGDTTNEPSDGDDEPEHIVLARPVLVDDLT